MGYLRKLDGGSLRIQNRCSWGGGGQKQEQSIVHEDRDI